MDIPTGFVPTRSSKLKKRPPDDFESVTFVSHKSKRNIPKTDRVDKRERDDGSGKEMDMKKLRYEVIKFGTSGMDRSQKEASSIALAVALGAKPPKKKYQNYKEILSAKKAEKQEKDKKTATPLNQPKNRHMYVVGNKVIPAKPKTKEGPKNFLEKYGNAGRLKGFKRKEPRS